MKLKGVKMQKRSPQLSRIIAYIKRRIGKGKTWKLGSKISSVSFISKDIGVGYTTARKAIRVLCSQGFLENRGNGFFVIGVPGKKLNTVLSQLDTLKKSAAAIKASKMLSLGGIWDPRELAVIVKDKKSLEIFYPVSIKTVVLDIDTIVSTIQNPITAKAALNDVTLVDEFKQQQQVKENINVVLPRLKKLDIIL